MKIHTWVQNYIDCNEISYLGTKLHRLLWNFIPGYKLHQLLWNFIPGYKIQLLWMFIPGYKTTSTIWMFIPGYKTTSTVVKFHTWVQNYFNVYETSYHGTKLMRIKHLKKLILCSVGSSFRRWDRLIFCYLHKFLCACKIREFPVLASHFYISSFLPLPIMEVSRLLTEDDWEMKYPSKKNFS
jgi:hypothetical protein